MYLQDIPQSVLKCPAVKIFQALTLSSLLFSTPNILPKTTMQWALNLGSPARRWAP